MQELTELAKIVAYHVSGVEGAIPEDDDYFIANGMYDKMCAGVARLQSDSSRAVAEQKGS